jgi:hypothetical protein
VGLNRRRTFVLVATGVFGAGVGGAVLVSAATTGTITGCVNGGNGALRITSDPTGYAGSACQSVFQEHAITFNSAGPAGPPGPQGPTGPSGTAGPSGPGGGTSSTPTTPQGTNFIAITSFPIPARHLVRAELDCPKGDLGAGGTSAMISPSGEAPAVGNADAGPGITSPSGHPAVGWTGEATNSSSTAASLKLSVICTGPDVNTAHVTKKVLLSRALRGTKTKKP